MSGRGHPLFLRPSFVSASVMASFKEFRQTLLLYYDADLISDEDFIILYDSFSSRNPDFAYDSYDRFDLDHMNDDECIAEFRVRKRDLPTLAQVLRIPPSFQLSQINNFLISLLTIWGEVWCSLHPSPWPFLSSENCLKKAQTALKLN